MVRPRTVQHDDPKHDDPIAEFVDDALPPGRVDALLDAVRDGVPGAAGRRDRLTTLQLIRDAIAGVEAPDDGFTLRVLSRLAAHRARRD
jgi:hypothetical protein